jgi:hypothetical protein
MFWPSSHFIPAVTLGDVTMKSITLLASLAALALTPVAAEARDRWHWRDHNQWEEEYYVQSDDEDTVSYYEEDDSDEVIIVNRRARMRAAEEEVERELWWLEENARERLENRAKSRKAAVRAPKPVVKKPVVKAAAKTPAPKAAKLETASLDKPQAKPKAKPVAAKPLAVKPAAKPSGKTIGCTAGAAVITGYGFGDVKPKACTGTSYAYLANRAGKLYEIRLAAASGEITDVKKLN